VKTTRDRIEGALRAAVCLARDAEHVVDRARRRGAKRPALSAVGDPSLWALALLRGATAARAVTGTSLGLSTVLRVAFHVDVWTDAIGPGLRLPHPFGIVIGGGTRLGADCTVLHGVTIEHGGVDVGRGAFLATGATLLAGSRVGDDAVLGARSVLRGDVPDRGVAVGAPARVVRTVQATEHLCTSSFRSAARTPAAPASAPTSAPSFPASQSAWRRPAER
jgi:serine acetyltransferase